MQTMPQSTIDKDVSRDERLIWRGRPATGIRLRSSDATTIPFSIFWAGFVAFMLFKSLEGITPDKPETYLLVLFGVPFLLM
jgi:hypothetical protein